MSTGTEAVSTNLFEYNIRDCFGTTGRQVLGPYKGFSRVIGNCKIKQTIQNVCKYPPLNMFAFSNAAPALIPQSPN